MDIWAIERTIKYLNFACRTFFKNVQTNIKISPNVRKNAKKKKTKKKEKKEKNKEEQNKQYFDLRPPWIKNQVFI